MPPPYHQPHWEAFVNAGYQPQGAVGYVPARWAQGLDGAPADLSNNQQTRQQVRAQCQNPNTDVLFGYALAMAWGGQGDRFGHRTLAWQNRQLIVPKLETLRAGGLNHCEAYNLFTGRNRVPGLGPSFFTKLIYFFSPNRCDGQVGFYIMDQWTAKSVDLLNQQQVVRLARTESASPGHNNRCGNYEAFCREVEHMAGALDLSGPDAGDQIEQRLMSEGGRDPQPWRQHVREEWPANAPGGRYSTTFMNELYPTIPLGCF